MMADKLRAADAMLVDRHLGCQYWFQRLTSRIQGQNSLGQKVSHSNGMGSVEELASLVIKEWMMRR